MDNFFGTLERNLMNLIYVYRIKVVDIDSSTDMAAKLPDVISSVVKHVEGLSAEAIEPGVSQMFAEVKAVSEKLTELDYRLIELYYGDRALVWIQKLEAQAEAEGEMNGSEHRSYETTLLYRHTHHARVLLEQLLKNHDPVLVPLILNEFRELPTSRRAAPVMEARKELDEFVESIWLQALWDGGEL